MSELSASLGDPALQDEAAGIIRSLIESITLTPVGNTLAIDLRGELASILSLCSGAGRKAAPADFSVEAFVSQVKMVAGTGFEPVTFRL